MIIFYEIGTELQALEFDATVRIRTVGLSEVSDHPVELGANATDHVRPGRREVSAEVHISNTPIEGGEFRSLDVHTDILKMREGADVQVRSLSGLGLGGRFSGPTAFDVHPAEYETEIRRDVANTMQFDDVQTRTVEVYERLLELQNDSTLLIVSYELAVISNMVITSLGVPRTAETGDSSLFELELEELRFSRVEVVDVPAPPDVEELRAMSKEEKGAQGTEEAGAQQESVWHRVSDSVTGFIGF